MRYLREALHNLTAGTSHTLEALCGVAIISSQGGYISRPNRDEMFKIVVQPIAFKEEHLLVLVSLDSFPPVFPAKRAQFISFFFLEKGSYFSSRFPSRASRLLRRSNKRD